MTTASKTTHERDDLRKSPEYIEGKTAYAAGHVECPHEKGGGNGKRGDWWTGWFDARTLDRLGHIFKRCGMTYP